MENHWIKKREDKDTQHIRDYILLMLGAPVVKIELDPQQLDFCIEITEKKLESISETHGCTRKPTVNQYTTLLTEGALAHAKYMLGRIRSKYKSPPGIKGVMMDGEALVAEAKQDLADWKAEVLWECGYTEWDNEQDKE